MRAGLYYNKRYLAQNRTILQTIERLMLSFGGFKQVERAEDLDEIDALLVLGGDGTILTLAAECGKRGVKILGINYGHMGFLASFEPERAEDAVKLLFLGDFHTEKRTMLEASYENKTYLAVNDLVVQRSTSGTAFSNTVSLTAKINSSTVDNFSADGIIVSTPTGSTAYSLSAGGSILTPDLEAFILTPVCAHSLHSRPVVFSNQSTLTITCEGDARSEINLVIDGKVVETTSALKPIEIRKSNYFVEFITDGSDFFDKLLKKLSIWSK